MARLLAERGRTAVLLGTSAVLLTLAGAPFGQWYLAWVALAPWLVAVGEARSFRSAILRGYLGGVIYFGLNLWWLWTASIPGTVVLILYFALFWAAVGGVIWGARLVNTTNPSHTHVATASFMQPGSLSEEEGVSIILRVVAVAIVWVAGEWLRCFVATGFPWMPVGSTQTPIPVMCQLADLGGPWLISFWVMLPNALAAIVWCNRGFHIYWKLPVAAVVGMLAVVAVYGVWRTQTTVTTAGPRVMVIQSNFRHLPGGAPTVSREDEAEFFADKLARELVEQPADLVVMPEAAFPPINAEARRELAHTTVGPFLNRTFEQLLQIAREHHTSLVFGGTAVTGWETHGAEHTGSEIRNSAYFLDPAANPPLVRYDKIYLARFSERAPISFGPTWLRSLVQIISAPRAVQPMYAGSLADQRPFQLSWTKGAGENAATARFISPICLENIDPSVLSLMIRGTASRAKQVDFVVNISNDGWFADQEKAQHLQTTIFRCIENRVPMVRCSNTGVSAFIDSLGRVQDAIGADKAGAAMRQIEFDGRHTLYTAYGDVFAIGCVGLAVMVLLAGRCQMWPRIL